MHVFTTLFSLVAIFCTFEKKILAEGQVLFNELPRELQKIFNSSDFATWRAPDDVWKNFPYYLSGYDDESRPIWVLELGKWPVKDFLVKGGEAMNEILGKHVNQILWNMYTHWGPLTDSDGNRVQEINVLIDMKGYSLTELTNLPSVNFLIQRLRVVTLVAKFSHVTYFVNTNYIGEKVLNIIKPVMGKGFENFEIYGTNSKIWLPMLLKRLPASQLPPWYGGSKDFKPVKAFG